MPAYNYYGPNYVNPYASAYYPQNYQPVQQANQQPQYVSAVQNVAPVQNGIIWVSGDDEANAFPLAPNNAVRLWHRTKPIVYFKEADASGRAAIKAYDLVEHVEVVPEASDTKAAKDYATKDELGAVVGVVKGFDELLAAIKTDVETMKGDMYGIAGKKKVSRKQEVSEDE